MAGVCLAAALLGVLTGLTASALVGSPTAVATAGEVPAPVAAGGPVAPTPSSSPAPAPSPPSVAAEASPAATGAAAGLLMFRGDPARRGGGTGPLPSQPAVDWRSPGPPMCSASTVGGETREWCGTGWTGQPAVWEHDGVTEVVFGAYDGAVHFLDAETGERVRPDFPTDDLIKGSVTIDPDGFPLLYFGSRDNRLRVVALDADGPRELWQLPAHPDALWNDDWDGNPVILDDVLLEGGEDGFVHAVRLNRGYDAEGRVTVAPEVLAQVPGWTPELIAATGDSNVSIESSLTVVDDVVYAANSGGRVVGLALPALLEGRAELVFDYWLGDDMDATLVAGPDGLLFAAVELERGLPRAAEVGQLVALDPDREGDPRVWGLALPAAPGTDGNGGAWSTPALHDGTLYVTTHAGELLAVDAATGAVRWRTDIGFHEWSSPVVVDDVLVVATCERGGISGYHLGGPVPRPAWRVDLESGGCIESTPAVWEGRIYVGSRDGYLYALSGTP